MDAWLLEQKGVNITGDACRSQCLACQENASANGDAKKEYQDGQHVAEIVVEIVNPIFSIQTFKSYEAHLFQHHQKSTKRVVVGIPHGRNFLLQG